MTGGKRTSSRRSAVVLPKLTQQPDDQGEFAFVIGPGGNNISADTWEEHVFGYTIMNDVSARDVPIATSQWSLGKSFDTFAPLGPAIVSQDEVPDPHALDLRLTISGNVLQHSHTRELIFRVPDLIQYFSAITRLEAGDIISTGTPRALELDALLVAGCVRGDDRYRGGRPRPVS